MADKKFKDYYNELTEASAIPSGGKILVQTGNVEPEKIDVGLITAKSADSDRLGGQLPSAYATSAQGALASNSVQLTGDQDVDGVKTFNDNVKVIGKIDLNDGSNGTIVGTDAGGTGINQSAFGYLAGRDNTGGNQSAFGYFAGYLNTGGNQSAFGYFAGYLNTGGNQSAVGSLAGYLNKGSDQSAFGSNAGRDNTGINQSAFGRDAGYLNTGINQSAFGRDAGRDNTGDFNIAIGIQGSNGNSGDNVLTIGFQAGLNNTQSNRTIIDNDLVPAFASNAAAIAAINIAGVQTGMTYLYFNTSNNAIEAVRT